MRVDGTVRRRNARQLSSVLIIKCSVERCHAVITLRAKTLSREIYAEKQTSQLDVTFLFKDALVLRD